MPRLIWVFVGRTVTLFVLSCRSSFVTIYYDLLRSRKYSSTTMIIHERSRLPIRYARLRTALHCTFWGKTVYTTFIFHSWLRHSWNIDIFSSLDEVRQRKLNIVHIFECVENISIISRVRSSWPCSVHSYVSWNLEDRKGKKWRTQDSKYRTRNIFKKINVAK